MRNGETNIRFSTHKKRYFIHKFSDKNVYEQPNNPCSSEGADNKKPKIPCSSEGGDNKQQREYIQLPLTESLDLSL